MFFLFTRSKIIAMAYRKANLQQVQKLYLSMFKKLDLFLEKKNIDYFAVGGTLLGTYRHQGFIPWDNDMDLGMTRDNYNRFIKVARELEKEGDFTLIGNPFTHYCEHGLIRVAFNGTEQANLNYKKKIDRRLAIDIFPFDMISNDKKKNSKIWKKIKRIKWMLDIKAREKSLKVIKNIGLKVFQFALSPITFKHLQLKMDRLATSSNKQPNLTRITNYYGAYSIERETTLFEIINKTSRLQFADTTIKCPIRAKEYLENVYGKNFMQPADIRFDVNSYYCYVEENTFEAYCK